MGTVTDTKIRVKHDGTFWRVIVPNLQEHPDAQSKHPAEGYPFHSWESAIKLAAMLAHIRLAIIEAHS